VDQPKNPDICSVFALYKLFASPEQQAALATRYRAGGMGYGEAKQALFEIAWQFFADARARREKLEADPATLEDILHDGAARARRKAAEVLDRARKACGLGIKAK
jgi:tryptophanyl-tRNA synthetase